MTWAQLVSWVWTCDGCGIRSSEEDDLVPVGWSHTMDGRDLCGECSP